MNERELIFKNSEERVRKSEEVNLKKKKATKGEKEVKKESLFFF